MNLQPEVIELHVKLTQKMLNVQTCLLDVMNVIVKELKRINKYVSYFFFLFFFASGDQDRRGRFVIIVFCFFLLYLSSISMN